MLDHVTPKGPAKFGMTGFLLAVVSLVVIVVQLSSIFEPLEPSVGTVIGEIAADIKQSAMRVMAGEPKPAPPPPDTDYSSIITHVALGFAGLGILFGGISIFRNEPHRLAYLAVGIGLSAIVMQYVFWLAVLICGIALLISIVKNLDGIIGLD